MTPADVVILTVVGMLMLLLLVSGAGLVIR